MNGTNEHMEYAVCVIDVDGGQQHIQPETVTENIDSASLNLDAWRYDIAYRREHEKHFTERKAVLVMRTVTDWCEVIEQDKKDDNK